MESNVQGQRYVTWFLMQLGNKSSDILRKQQEVCKDSAPSKSTLYRWVDDFKSGKSSTDNFPKAGRPSTAVIPETIQLVADFVKKDPRIT